MTSNWEGHRALAAVVVFVVALASPRAVLAAPDPRELQARQAYAAGRYEDAIELYSQLYAEKLHPVYLRNVGRCYQSLGKPDRAIASFREYLRKAKNLSADEKTEVQEFIAESEAEQRRIAAGAPPPAVATLAVTAPVTDAPSMEPPAVAQRTLPQPIDVPAAPPTSVAAASEAPPSGPAGSAPATGPEATAHPPWVPGRSSFVAGVSAGATVFAAGGPADDLGLAAALQASHDFLVNGPTAFQLTAHAGYAAAGDDGGSHVSLVSVLAGPAARRALSPRLAVSFAVQAGVQIWAGLQRSSALYPMPSETPEPMVSFSLRGALPLEWQLARALSLVLSPALVYASRPDPNFREAMLRFDLQLGVALRL